MESGGTTNPDIRTIFRTPEYDEFYGSLSQKVQVKFDYFVSVIASVYNIPVKFVKHLEKTDLYEMRVSVGTNEYRTVLFAIDQENVIEAKKRHSPEWISQERYQAISQRDRKGEIDFKQT